MPNPYITNIRLPDGTIVDLRGDPITSNIRYASTAEWNSDPTLIPDRGQVIVYSDAKTIEIDGETVYVPRIKIGDGLAYLIDLPFHDVHMMKHMSDSVIHVTSEDKIFWNNKLNYLLTGENLIFNRL